MTIFRNSCAAALIFVCGGESHSADGLHCRLVCAEMTAPHVDSADDVNSNFAVRRQEDLLKAQDKATDAAKYWYAASNGMRYLGAVADGIDIDIHRPAAWGNIAATAALGVGVEFTKQMSETLRDKAIKAKVDYMYGAVDQALGGVLIKDHIITPEGLEENREKIEKLFYDTKFQSKIDPELLQTLEFGRKKINFDLLVHTLGASRRIEGGVSQLQFKADSAQRALEALGRAGRRLSTSLAANEKAMDERQTEIKSELIRQKLILTSNIPPRQQLALAGQGVLSLDLDEYTRLSRAVQIEDIQAIQSDIRTAAIAIRGLGLDLPLQNFLETGADALDKTLGLMTAFANPTPFGVAIGVMNMVGFVRGLGHSNEPSAEVQMLQEVLKQVRALREEMYRYHREEMQKLDDIQQDLAAFRDSVETRIDVLSDRTLSIQLGINELLGNDAGFCQVMRDAYFETPMAKKDGGWSLVQFDHWWEDQTLSSDYRNCQASLLRNVGYGENELAVRSGISRIFRVVLSDTPSGVGSVTSQSVRAQQNRDFLAQTLHPTVSYIAKYTTRKEQLAWLYVPRRRWDSLDVSILPAGAVDWTPPQSLTSVGILTPAQEDMVAVDVVIAASRYVRLVARLDALTVERKGVFRPITSADIVGRGTPPRYKATKLVTDMETLVRASIAQEHVVAGTPAIAHIVKVLDEEILPAYAAARRKGRWQDISRRLEQSGKSIESLRNCATGDDIYDTLCVMQANSLLADNAMRALISLRLSRFGISGEAYKLALMSGEGRAVERVIGRDALLADGEERAAYPSLTPSTAVPVPGWSIELPRVFPPFSLKLSSNEKPEMPPDNLRDPSNCWKDPTWKFDIYAPGVVENSTKIRELWTRCYGLPSDRLITRGQFVFRPQFQLLTDELYALQVSKANMRDEKSLPPGMRALVSINVWMRGESPSAIDLRDRIGDDTKPGK